jgi:hypothetical protein
LDPDSPRNTAIKTGAARTLSPLNFAAQFIASDDAEASIRAENAARMICSGKLSPDTDFRAQWIAMFGDNMVRA